MVCLACGEKSEVYNSRQQVKTNAVWRRRRCLKCGTSFTSEELPLLSTVLAVEKDGRPYPFSTDRLFLSLHRSLGYRPTAIEDARQLARTISMRLVRQHQGLPIISTEAIVQAVLVTLNRFDKPAATHYGAYHS